jgi:hypothetical protein
LVWFWRLWFFTVNILEKNHCSTWVRGGARLWR